MNQGAFASGAALAVTSFERKAEMLITPFAIEVKPAVVDDLHARLRAVRWSDAVSDGWDYGMERNTLQEAIAR